MKTTLSVIVIGLMFGGNAYATCANVLPTLEGGIVTVPYDGEVGMPKDGRLWVLGGRVSSVEVHWLNAAGESSREIVYSGETVEGDWFVFDFPTDMEEQETIQYSLTVTKSGDSIEFGPFSFVTSGAEKSVPEILDLYGISFDKLTLGGRWYLSENCESILAVQGCPDGETERVVSANIEASGAALYRVWVERKAAFGSPVSSSGILFPARCRPQQYIDLAHSDKDRVCLRVEALNIKGEVSESHRVCGDDSGFFGCAFSSALGSNTRANDGLALLLFVAVTLLVGLKNRPSRQTSSNAPWH